MSILQERVPPADPWHISLTYAHDHPWWYSADDALVTWHVSADIDKDSGPGADAHVGDLDITLIRDETRDPFTLLDGWDAELGHIAQVIFGLEDGQLDPTLDDQLEVGGTQILILHHVQLTPQWRGFGPGASARRVGDQEALQRRTRGNLLPGPAQRADRGNARRL